MLEPSPALAESGVSPAALPSRLWLHVRFLVFFAMHAAVVLALAFTSVGPGWLALCAVSYLVRMLGVSAAYHRYFSHRSFRTSRAFQLVLALWAQSANQNGVLWWAAHHRKHHRHSDQAGDPHSPLRDGLVRAHLTWFIHTENWSVDERFVADWLKYPELRFLQRHPALPTMALALACFVCLGWDGLYWGFVLPTVLLLHATFTVNSLNHRFGSRPYDTGDESRNNGLLAVLTLGEGWHNNHHHRPGSAAVGWRWYQFDPTFRVLQVLQWLGLVWDVKRPVPTGS